MYVYMATPYISVRAVTDIYNLNGHAKHARLSNEEVEVHAKLTRSYGSTLLELQ